MNTLLHFISLAALYAALFTVVGWRETPPAYLANAFNLNTHKENS